MKTPDKLVLGPLRDKRAKNVQFDLTMVSISTL